jgi:hypothetical protein
MELSRSRMLPFRAIFSLGAVCLGLGLLCGVATLPAQHVDNSLSEAEIQRIIRAFSEKESAFLKAREQYTYKQSVKVAELTPGGRESGKYEYRSDVIFGPNKERIEKVTWAPVNTLKAIQITPEDEQDLRSIQPFVLNAENVGDYHIRYLGKQNADEISCYLFAVKPKQMVKGERYFSGLIWVDDQDLQIVKTYGRGVGLLGKNSNQQFPKFETYRDQVDGKFWFPVYTIAETILPFQSGPVPIKMVVKYDDYKLFGSTVDIKFGGEVENPPAEQPATPPKPNPQRR